MTIPTTYLLALLIKNKKRGVHRDVCQPDKEDAERSVNTKPFGAVRVRVRVRVRMGVGAGVRVCECIHTFAC